jgi:hypothetical protein
MDLQANVKQHNAGSATYVNPMSPNLHNDEPEESGKNVNELDILIQQLKQNKLKKPRKKIFEPVVQLTESLLDDDHSGAMFYKVLNALCPDRLDLYVAAVRVAVQAAETDPTVNSGAVFVRSLREFAEVAGVDLGLKDNSKNQNENIQDNGIQPGTDVPLPSDVTLTPPSVDEAIWAETQSVLQRQMTRATYDAIIQGTRLIGRSDGIYIVGVQSDMAQEWLENRLRDIVQRALASVIGTSVDIEFRQMNKH